MKFGTKAIHAGLQPDPSTGAIMTPIYQTSTYVQKAPGDHQGYEYARTKNPTRSALEANLAALENGNYGVCFGSGMAAIDSLAKLLKPGDHVVSTNDLYGGTYRLFTKVFQKYGIDFDFVDMQDPENVAKVVSSKTRMVWVETPTNPMVNIIDIAAVAKIAKKAGAWTVVDNTFATPYLQQPLDLGADFVTHSATKYLGGHSDTVLGAVVCKDKELADQLYFIQNATGGISGPMDSFLVLRGIKTLHVRMKQHCQNARAIVDFLENHSAVDKVNYPGLSNHKGHEIAKKQMRDFGGMLSFSLKNDTIEAAHLMMTQTKLFSLAESLGGVESLIGHPASMTHASIPLEERLKTGVTNSLIRVSVGIEDEEDLIADLKNALEKVEAMALTTTH